MFLDVSYIWKVSISVIERCREIDNFMTCIYAYMTCVYDFGFIAIFFIYNTIYHIIKASLSIDVDKNELLF